MSTASDGCQAVWKTEYRLADYGTDRLIQLAAGFPTPDHFELTKRIHTVRSELVWRFNWSGAASR